MFLVVIFVYNPTVTQTPKFRKAITICCSSSIGIFKCAQEFFFYFQTTRKEKKNSYCPHLRKKRNWANVLKLIFQSHKLWKGWKLNFVPSSATKLTRLSREIKGKVFDMQEIPGYIKWKTWYKSRWCGFIFILCHRA